jgi:uncharacterized protein
LADDTRPTDLNLSICESISDIDRADWNAIANPAGQSYDPFLDHDFLEALESSGSASPRTGWGPRHLAIRDRRGNLLAAAPLYLKAHSRGEFVFDHSWADALERAGGRYYPKLLCATPFTPVTGRRLLTATGPRAAVLQGTLVRAAIGLAEDAGLSSVHFNFLTEETSEALWDQHGLLARIDQQFHWCNRDYRDFDEFLDALASRKRKMIRKERAAAQSGLDIQRLTGDAIEERHWDAFFRFYMDTGGRKWGSPYLNRTFFALMHERMRDKVLLVLAFQDGRPVAGALNLIGSDALYGRYWGRIADIPFLHFEVCYYQAIEFAIERGLARVEAGAQGEHKLARGYEPRPTRSAHWIQHPGLRDAVARYLDAERTAVAEGIAQLAAFAPFRRDGDSVEAGDAPIEEESF